MSTDPDQRPDALRRTEVVQRELSRSRRQHRRQAIQDAVDECGRLLYGEPATSAYLEVLDIFTEQLFPLLFPDDDAFWRLRSEVTATDDVTFDAVAVRRVRDDPERFRERLLEGGPRARNAERTIDDVVASLESAAAVEGVIRAAYQTHADALGFASKLGEHKQRPEMDFGERVAAVSEEHGSMKSFYSGRTGSAKSSTAAAQFEDYYRRDEPYKLLDIVGMAPENLTHDIPMQHNELRFVREEKLDLPPSFAEIDGYEPDLEILVPLTPDLAGQQLPYDTEADEFVPKPFTIAAADLSQDLIMNILAERVSPDEVNLIRRTIERVTANGGDWSLADLVEEIWRQDELQEKNQHAAVGAVKALHDVGYIRTRDDPHRLEWDRIFRDTETITAFSQAPCRDEFAKFLVIAHIIDTLWLERDEMSNYPMAVPWLRELWEICPHAQSRRERSPRIKAVLDHIVQRVKALLRKARDRNLSFIGDTQEPNDVEKGVRRRWNRYVIMSGNDDTVKDIVSWAGVGNFASVQSTLTQSAGEGSILGLTGPSVANDNLWGIGPVQFAPPAWHHYDKDEEISGWHSRVGYFDHEELRTVEWELSIPPELELPSKSDIEADREAEVDDEDTSKQAIRMEARNRKRRGQSIRDIRDGIPNNPQTGRPFSKDAISRWTKDVEKGGALEQPDELHED